MPSFDRVVAARIESMERRVLLSQSPLVPDPTFDGDGFVRKASGTMSEHIFGHAVLPLAGGKVLVGGTTSQGHGSVFVARYNRDGTPDATFADGGWFRTGRLRYVTAFAVQPDGTVVAAGVTHRLFDGPVGGDDHDFGTQFAAVRITASGALDASFGDQGRARVNFEDGFDSVRDVAVGPDGKIVLVGYTTRRAENPDADMVHPGAPASDLASMVIGPSYFAMARLNADGSLDTSFDGDGKYVREAQSDSWASPASVAVTPDGKIVVGAGGGVAEGAARLARFSVDGSPDGSFSGDGVAEIARMAGIQDLLLRADGDVVAVGESMWDGPGHPHDPENRSLPAKYVLARYDADGTPDDAFGDDGLVFATVQLKAPRLMDLAVAELADGSFAVAGGDFERVFAALFEADGTLVRTAVYEPADGGSGRPRIALAPQVALDEDGNVLTVGLGAGAYLPPRPFDPPGWWNDLTTHLVVGRFLRPGATVPAPAPAPTDPPPAPQPPAVPPAPAPTDPPVTTPAPNPAAPNLSATFIGPSAVRGGRSYTFRIAYRLSGTFDVSTLRAPGSVTVTGPDGSTHAANLLRLNRLRGGRIAIGVYRMASPGGAFDAGDAGRYAVRLGGGLFAPTSGTTAPPAVGTTIGEFQVRQPKTAPKTIGRRK